MFKRILIGLASWMAALSVMAGQELALALRDVPAPRTEFIRTPAKYVFKKLSDTAHRSGKPELSSFSIAYDLAGCDDVKISINLADRTLLDALLEAAKATGAGVVFQERGIALKDPSQVEELVLPDPEPEVKPEAMEDEPEEVETKKSRKKVDLKPGFEFSDVSHAIIFVENGDGSGSGFIAEMDGKTYVFSNQHNFLGAKRIVMRAMNGEALKPKTFEYSRTHDLVRMELDPADLEGLKALKLSQETPSIDDKIVVYGNSAGGGVATELKGEVEGVGPSDIEVNADFVPGNSGSPILNEDAEVIGVATYATLGMEFEKDSAYKKMFKGTRFAKVRRYGVRIPNEGWVSDSLSFFLRQTYRLEDMKTYCMAVFALYKHWMGDKNFESYVNRLIESYGHINSTSEPPIKFKMKENEELMRRVVRSFSINYNSMTEDSKRLYTLKREDEIRRMKNLLTQGIEEISEPIDNTFWKTNLLKQNAREMKDIANEIINQIKESKGPASQNNKSRR